MSRKLLTIDEAIVFLNNIHQINPDSGRNVYSKKTLYNMIHKKRLKRFGPRHLVQLDQDDLIRVLGT